MPSDCIFSLVHSQIGIKSHLLFWGEKKKALTTGFQLANCSFLGLPIACHDNDLVLAYARGNLPFQDLPVPLKKCEGLIKKITGKERVVKAASCVE